MKKYKTIILLGCCGMLGAFLYFHVNQDSKPRTVQAETVKLEDGTEEAQQVFEAPKTFKKEIPGSSLSFDAEVIVPEGFDGGNLYLGTAVQKIDKDQARSILFGNAALQQETMEDIVDLWGEKQPEETDEDEEGNYMLLEGDDYLCYGSLEGEYVDNCVRVGALAAKNNIEALKKVDSLDFMDKTQAREEVESFLQNIGISAEENQYSIFALDTETLKEQEITEDMAGNYTEEGKNPEWTKDQEGYYFFGEQTFQGLPVWHKFTVSDWGYFENLEEMPIQIFYSTKGIRSCMLTHCYQIKREEEKITLAPFEKIIETIENKYKDLDTNGLIVRKIKLTEFPRHQKDGTFQMVPMWICFMDVITSDGERESGDKQMPINAITGEEEIAVEGDSI